MKKLRLLGAVLACIVVVSFNARAALVHEAMTGYELERRCGDTGVGNGLCTGFIWGVADGLLLITHTEALAAQTNIKTINSGPDPIICVPDGISPRDLTDIVLKYMNDNPANMYFPAGLLVYYALGEAFPCKAT